IYNSSPLESNYENNKDTLRFTTFAKMKAPVTISGNLDMVMAAPDQLPEWIGGKIMLGDNDLIVNGNILNFDSTHYIITNGTGRLKLINNNAENIFPVASSDSSLNFVKLTNTGTPDNFSVRVADYVLQQGNAGDTVRLSWVDRTWFMEEEAPGGSNVTAEFWWSASHELAGFNRNLSRTAHYTNAWEYGVLGAAVIGRYNQFSKVQSGFTSFSPFSINTPGGALPLTFLSFSATNRSEDVLVSWRTQQEVNTSQFVVERSGDGISFTAIGTVSAANTTGIHDYQFKDISPLPGISYYRLKQVDVDGRFIYSTVAKVTRQNSKPIVLYPNPATEFVQLKNVNVQDVKMVQLFSTEGRMIWQVANPSSLQWSIGQLPNAMYQLRVTNATGETQTISFIKH
ncbi:MAG: T9SS type A sorting domain-containing protein, partial [Pedobacter sp.]